MRPLACSLVILSMAFGAATASASPPNVVMIISDDHGWGDYSFMGHPVIRTPHLDRLASQSLTFTRGYVPTSLCRPSLVTLVTGLYPHQHKVTGNDPLALSPGKARLRRNEPESQALIAKLNDTVKELPALPRLLGEAGYLSLQTGKWWEGHYSSGGFTHGMTHGEPARGGRHGDEGLKIGRQGMKPIFEFIDSAKSQDRPFFIWYAPFLPHLPHDPPQRLLDKYTAPDRPEAVARYYAMVDWFDETCGQLLDYLEKQGLAENTVVLYIADNGWVQPQEITDGAVGGARGKRTPNEGGTRTPILVRWPGRMQPLRDDQTLVSAIDLVPTVLKACGRPIPAELPGLNLLDASALRQRDAIFGESFTHDVVELGKPAASLLTRWCIEGNWKLIVPYHVQEPYVTPELYDLAADPHERTNLAASHPDRVRALHRRIEAWWPLGQAHENARP